MVLGGKGNRNVHKLFYTYHFTCSKGHRIHFQLSFDFNWQTMRSRMGEEWDLQWKVSKFYMDINACVWNITKFSFDWYLNCHVEWLRRELKNWGVSTGPISEFRIVTEFILNNDLTLICKLWHLKWGSMVKSSVKNNMGIYSRD